jgi:small-conductance mechanosensitive channel
MNTPIKETSGLAISSLVFGIASWFVIPFIGSIVAVIAGHMARKNIRLNPETKQGDALAIAGLILGWLNILTMVIMLIFFGGIILSLLAGLGIAIGTQP